MAMQLKMAQQMENLARGGTRRLFRLESAREEIGIQRSYWESLDAIAHWKQNTDHLIAQQKRH